ncbi:MAG: sigma-70 family RNA polymerase sigma factor [Caryophanon sp.]|nr:sigma-70 family RNA polymerase sigma factor [Caryophanon sp.]
MTQLDAIMKEHSQHLVRIAYLYVKDWGTAEDIVQDVFIKFFQTSDQFRQEASLKTYLTKMTANRAKDHLRSWKYKKQVLFDNVFSQVRGVDEHVVEKEELKMLGKLLFELPLKYREPLILYYYNEQSIAEIAQDLSLNENTVKTRLRRAKQQMKGFFAQQEATEYDRI